MKAIIINNEIRYDEDSMSLAELGYQIGEEVEVYEIEGFYMMSLKDHVYVDGTLAIFQGEQFVVSNEEIEVVA
ncbi:hypothetical protein AKS96_61 [Escherichia phage vB_EcoS_AKS96]|uniref:Uncharacterized protein n=1 Tax=Escherichia phage vB_EcoS_AKS96 TaxID=1416031 RepID=A0A067YXW9_9CAUD|nr:hypothetical protein LD31_gp61 [Escherichia phage vB_EcoS_AKS96]AHI60764.1 hypothetical protein AKS96_61 [Escherichia phage vB_EcoS_AKS96]